MPGNSNTSEKIQTNEEGSEFLRFTEPTKLDFSEQESSSEEANGDCHAEETSTETEEERQRREEEESIELARMLMAEEAMASYHHSVQMLHESRDQLPEEDYEALRAALQEDVEADETELQEDEEGNLSYETMLQIGERIGNVKQDRWAMVARSRIEKLPIETYKPDSFGADADDSEHKCLICQHEYCSNEQLRRLPCGHCFHVECVDEWLMRTDLCPYCRTSIKNESS